jgi:hypothetical protein
MAPGPECSFAGDCDKYDSVLRSGPTESPIPTKCTRKLYPSRRYGNAVSIGPTRDAAPWKCSIKWQEAQRLAQLPPFAAADGLAQTLRAVPAVRALRLDVKMIAERLVALLPAQGTITEGQSPSKLALTPVQVPRALTFLMMGAIFGGLLMPLLMPQQAETVAPASWIADTSKAPVKPQAVSGPGGSNETLVQAKSVKTRLRL